MSEDNLRKRISRGASMREWANGSDGLFSIFDAVRANYLSTIADSAHHESNVREAAYHRIAALSDLRTAMEVVIADGGGAQAMLTKLASIQEKKNVR